MEWLFENPLPELLICGVLASVCAVIALQTQRGVILLGTVLFLLLGVGAWFLDRGTQTDREAVEQSIDDIVAAFQAKDLEGTLKHISPQAHRLRLIATWAVQTVDVGDDARITDVSVDFSNQNSIARSHFRVNSTISITGYGNQGWHPTRWEAEWQKSEQGWLMTDIVELDVVTGSEIEFPFPE